MRAVFSAMRRSLARLAIALASARHKARRRNRVVSSVGGLPASRVSAGRRSSNVIARAPSKLMRGAGIPSPLMEPVGPAGSTDAGGPYEVHRLLGRTLRHRIDRYVDATLGFGTELDFAVGEREQGVVLAEADILPRVPLGAPLARQDVASEHLFAAENLQAQALGMRIAAVARRAACFLVCHRDQSFS